MKRRRKDIRILRKEHLTLPFVLSKVQARSGVSKKDFINHMQIARKESKESKRWIQMMVAADLVAQKRIQLLLNENEGIISILVTIVKNAQQNKD